MVKLSDTILTIAKDAALLHSKCPEISAVTDDVREVARFLEDYLNIHRHDEPRPVGVSAPQVGAKLRMFSYVTNPQATGDDLFTATVINPVLVYEKNIRLVRETCLSVPGKTFMIKRGKVVKIRGMDLGGAIRTFKGHDLVAQVLLHESNHLDGLTVELVYELQERRRQAKR